MRPDRHPGSIREGMRFERGEYRAETTEPARCLTLLLMVAVPFVDEPNAGIGEKISGGSKHGIG